MTGPDKVAIRRAKPIRQIVAGSVLAASVIGWGAAPSLGMMSAVPIVRQVPAPGAAEGLDPLEAGSSPTETPQAAAPPAAAPQAAAPQAAPARSVSTRDAATRDVRSGEDLADGVRVPSYTDKFLRMLYTLGAMVLALFLVAKFLPRLLKSKSGAGDGGLFGGLTGTGRRMQVVERVRLDARKSLCLVRVGGRYLLLGVSDQRVERIAGEELDVAALRALDGVEAQGDDPTRPTTDLERDATAPASGAGVSEFGSRLLRRAQERSRDEATDNRGDKR